jgi:sugar/nucleoside kinase (ribokinase family)
MPEDDERDFDVVVVGDINADLVLSGEVTPTYGQVEKLLDDATLTIGGSSAIFACGAARLGLRVAFVGKVGADDFGRFMVDAVGARGVDIGGVVCDPALKTGLTVILARGQDRALLTYLGTIGALHFDEIDLDYIGRARHLHMGSYYMLDSLRADVPRLFAAAHARGLTVSLDTNYDPTERWEGGIHEALEHVDIFLPNATELTKIGRHSTWQGALALLAERVPLVVAKLGAHGAIARRGAAEVAAPTLPVQVVDATGAGDSCDAGFVYGFLNGWDLPQTLRLATVCGALSTRGVGGTTAQPTLAEVLGALG